jgi:NADPH2:quinone reductase
MRAAVYKSTGPAADVLNVEEIDRPEPGLGEVLVRVHASGINPTDHKARSGMVTRPIHGFQIPHHDGAGVIEAVGAEVDPARRPAGLAVARGARPEVGDRRRVDRAA